MPTASLQTPVLSTLAADLVQMELNVVVDEADVGQVAAGQAASFTVDAYPDRSFPATITRVRYASETVDGVVTYGVLQGPRQGPGSTTSICQAAA